MPRNPLYHRTHKLELDYNPEGNHYELKRNNEERGSKYKTDRQAISLIETFNHLRKNDPTFKNIQFTITPKARKQLGLEEKVDSHK